MSQNRIIVPAQYDIEIKMLFNPRTGQTEMTIRNKGSIVVSMLQIAGVIAEHQTLLLKQIISGELNRNTAGKVVTGDPVIEKGDSNGDGNA